MEELTQHYQWLINTMFGVILLAVGWWCRQVWDAIQELKTDMNALEKALPTVYVRQIDAAATARRLEDRILDCNTRHEKARAEDMAEIRSSLTRIFDKLDNKADK